MTELLLAAASVLLAQTELRSVPPADPVVEFVAWAESEGHQLEAPACHDNPTLMVCYGLADEAVIVRMTPTDEAVGEPLVLTFLLDAEGSLDENPTITAAGPAEPATTFGPGLQLVGENVQAGTYVAQALDGCYWERLSGFSGESEDIIANDFIAEPGQVVVEIAPTDAGFSSSGCGTWSRL
jgi:hypothetical protein